MWVRAPLWASLQGLHDGYFVGRGNRLSCDVIGSAGFLSDVGAPGYFDVNQVRLNAAGGVDARYVF